MEYTHRYLFWMGVGAAVMAVILLAGVILLLCATTSNGGVRSSNLTPILGMGIGLSWLSAVLISTSRVVKGHDARIRVLEAMVKEQEHALARQKDAVAYAQVLLEEQGGDSGKPAI